MILSDSVDSIYYMVQVEILNYSKEFITVRVRNDYLYAYFEKNEDWLMMAILLLTAIFIIKYNAVKSTIGIIYYLHYIYYYNIRVMYKFYGLKN